MSIIVKREEDLEAEFVILPNMHHEESWIIPTLIVRKKEIFNFVANFFITF